MDSKRDILIHYVPSWLFSIWTNIFLNSETPVYRKLQVCGSSWNSWQHKSKHITVAPTLCLTIIPEMHENHILKVNAVILISDSSKQHHTVLPVMWKWMQFMEWWPRVGPSSNTEQNAWSFIQKWSYCNTKTFLGAIRCHAGSCQKHYKQSNTAEVKRVTATQRHYWIQFNTMWVPVKTIIYSDEPLPRTSIWKQKCNHTPRIWPLGEREQTSRAAKQHSPTKSMRTAADNLEIHVTQFGKYWVQVCLFCYIIMVLHELTEQEKQQWMHFTILTIWLRCTPQHMVLWQNLFPFGQKCQ